MAQELIAPFVVLSCVVLAVMGARSFAARTTHLRLELFRPWRGDPWPVGVQEDDDFRFAWTPEARAAASVVSGGGGGPGSGSQTGSDGGAADPVTASFETVDASGGPFPVTPVGRVRQVRVGRVDGPSRSR